MWFIRGCSKDEGLLKSALICWCLWLVLFHPRVSSGAVGCSLMGRNECSCNLREGDVIWLNQLPSQQIWAFPITPLIANEPRCWMTEQNSRQKLSTHLCRSDVASPFMLNYLWKWVWLGGDAPCLLSSLPVLTNSLILHIPGNYYGMKVVCIWIWLGVSNASIYMWVKMLHSRVTSD